MHGVGIILSVMLGASVTLAASPGYLLAVGPAALRFQTSVASGTRVALPPLRAEEAGPPSPSEPGEPKPADLASEPELDSQPSETAAAALAAPVPASTNSVAPPIVSTNDTNAVVSPQMLLRFFLPSESGPPREAVVLPPPGFIPARAAPSPGSSAKFTSAKP